MVVVVDLKKMTEQFTDFQSGKLPSQVSVSKL